MTASFRPSLYISFADSSYLFPAKIASVYVYLKKFKTIPSRGEKLFEKGSLLSFWQGGESLLWITWQGVTNCCEQASGDTALWISWCILTAAQLICFCSLWLLFLKYIVELYVQFITVQNSTYNTVRHFELTLLRIRIYVYVCSNRRNFDFLIPST